MVPRGYFSEVAGAIASAANVVSIRLQTNGLLLGPALGPLREAFPNLELAVSFDGPGELSHYRRDRNGEPTGERVERAIAELDNQNLAYGIVCVVSRANVDHVAEILRWATTRQGLRTLRFAPTFDTQRVQTSDVVRSSFASSAVGEHEWAISPSEYTTFLTGAWDIWTGERLFRRFDLEPLASYLRAVNEIPTPSCHFEQRKCNHVLTLYPGGSRTLCDELVDVRVTGADVMGLGGAAARTELDVLAHQCSSCDVRDHCGGGCTAVRLRLARVGRAGEYCEHRKAILRLVGDGPSY